MFASTLESPSKPLPQKKIITVSYHPRGAAHDLFTSHAAEVLIAGPAGTGKSRAALEKVHLICSTVPGIRWLMVRKTLASLTATGLVTFRERVLHPMDGVTFFGGSKQLPAQFQYPNGSTIVVGGMDKPSKIMSGEYDGVYVQEATELVENDWETLTTRLRNGVLAYQQLVADCNPDTPTHWLKQRCNTGVTLMLESRHEDNPTIWDSQRGEWTEKGAAYISKLDALTGARLQRLRYGRWVAAEGLIYDGWDASKHLIDRFEIPAEWPRYWAVDFGYTNPFVWQEWREDPDGRLYLTREIYRVQRLVTDHAAEIVQTVRRDAGLAAVGPLPPALRPQAIVCDHDAEDRATLAGAIGMNTLPAVKKVSPGIQAVAQRLRVAGDGRPRLMVLRDSLTERDQTLDDARKPCGLAEEMDGYVWDTSAGRNKGEQPVKRDDHSEDAARYLVAFVDNLAIDPEVVDEQVTWDEPVAISAY